jgi:hypothetical protein
VRGWWAGVGPGFQGEVQDVGTQLSGGPGVRFCRVPCLAPTPGRLLHSLQRYSYDFEQLCLVWTEVESLRLEVSPVARTAAFAVMDAISQFHRDKLGALRWEFVRMLRGHDGDYKVMETSLSKLVDDGASIDPLGPAVVQVLLRWLQDSGARPAGIRVARP